MHQHILIRTNRLTNGLFAVLALLVLANFLISLPYLHRTAEIHGLARLLSLDGERNLPTAYNVFLLLADAVLLFVIAARAIRERLVESLGWLTLSIGFVFMAMDEAWTIHEDLIGPIRQRLGAGHLGLLYNAWILPGIAVTGLIGLAYLRFLKALPRPTRIGFVLSAVIYLSGALGVEAIDGSYFEVHGNNFTYKVLTMVEEGLEMSGLILFCRYLLQYIRSQYDSIQFTFSDAVKEPKLKKVKDPATIRRIPGLEARPDERIILPAAHRRQTE